MNKVSREQILELALRSSDPLIKATVDKLVFALKLKHADADFTHIIDNYKYHHSTVLHFANDKEVSLAWINEDFCFISMDSVYYQGKASDMVAGEPIAHHYIAPETTYINPKYAYHETPLDNKISTKTN